MTAREYLGQAYWLNKRIDTKMTQIDQLRALTQRVTTNYEAEVVSRSRNLTQMQDTIVKLMDAAEELNRDVDRLLDLKKQIASILERVRSDRYRVVLEMRYLAFEKWEKIAKELECSPRSAQNWHDRALGVVDRLLDTYDKPLIDVKAGESPMFKSV